MRWSVSRRDAYARKAVTGPSQRSGEEDMQKKRLGILIEVDSFIGDIREHLSRDYEIVAIKPRNLQDIEKVVEWADVVWFEFFNELFLHAINQNIKAKGKRVIARWHRFEIVESNFPQRVRFENIDDLILVSHDMLRVLKNRVPNLDARTRSHVVWNGVNLAKFAPLQTLDRKKIAWVAKPFLRKNQPMFLQIMHELVKRDPSYTLHLAGEVEEFVTLPYLKRTSEKLGLSRNVFFHGWQQDMPAFLADKGVILSTSIHESFGYNIAEAMAVGALPIVHDYPGAEEFWPEEIRFSSIAHAVDLILAGQTHQWAGYVAEKFPLSKQLLEIDAVMTGNRITPAATPSQGIPSAVASLLSAAVGYGQAPSAAVTPPPPPAAAPIPVAAPAYPVAAPSLASPSFAPAPSFVPASTPVERALAFDSSSYWEERYRQGGNSGAGSYDQLARYKGLVINFFAQQKKLTSFAELGSGDGNQLRYFNFENYTGFDISQTVIAKTKALYAEKRNYSFVWSGDPGLDWEQHEQEYECAMSLDVLYHLIDDRIFTEYMDRLFSLSTNYVIIYASNFDAPDKRGAAHVRHRKFVDFVAQRYPQWTLLKYLENPYKFKLQTEADFAIYGRDDGDSLAFLDAIANLEVNA
jgi:glycosyltransferase involved in cell wall biosynthesis